MEQICSNCFVFPVLEWVLVVLELRLTKMHQMEGTSMLLQLLCQVYQLHCPSSVYWLMSVSQKPDDNCSLDVTYRRLFFYNRLAQGPAYTRNTDDRLVKLYYFLRFVRVFYSSSVKLDASFAGMSLLQIKHFPALWFTDRNGFLSSSINI